MNRVGALQLCLRITDTKGNVLPSLRTAILRDPDAMAQQTGHPVGIDKMPDPAGKVVDMAATAVGIFRQEGFPNSGMPQAATPEFIADALIEAGYTCTMLPVEDLACAQALNTRKIHTLILTSGQTFPVEVLSNLRTFLGDGGRLICPAGVPFSHPVTWRDDGWHDEGYAGGISGMIFEKLLPFDTSYQAQRNITAAVLLDQTLMPDLPVYWPLTGGQVGFIAKVTDSDGRAVSIGANRHLVVSLTDEGDAASTPVWFTANYSRVLLLGFMGESHPWNPAAWDYARQAVVDCVRLVTQQQIVSIQDIMPYQPLYATGETVKVDVLVRCTAGPADTTSVRMDIRERDGGRTAFSTTQTADFNPGERKYLTFQWPDAQLPKWAYEIVITASPRNGPVTTDTELFVTWHEETIHDAPAVKTDNDILYCDDRPIRMDGANIYLDDNRNIGMDWGAVEYPDGKTRYRSLHAIRDEHMGWLAAVGARAVRESYSTRPIVNNWGSTTQNQYRTTDSWMMMAAGNRFINEVQFNWAWQRNFKQGAYIKATTDQQRRNIEVDMLDSCKDLGVRYKDMSNLVIDLVNEPDRDLSEWTPQQRRQGFDDVKRHLSELRNYIEAGHGGKLVCGTQNTQSGFDPRFDRRALLYIIDFTAHHTYSYLHSYERSRLNWAISWNLGRPCHAGEVGFGPTWQYEQQQRYNLAENGWGYSHFYLFQAYGGNHCRPLNREDRTERDWSKPFKRYMAMQQIIKPDQLSGTLTVTGQAPSRYVKLASNRLMMPWSGAIKMQNNPWNPDKKLFLVQAVGIAATIQAAVSFSHLQLVDNYVVGPWARYELK